VKALHFLLNLAAFSIPAMLAMLASALLSKRSKEEWRLLAWVPPLPLVAWAIFIAWGTTRDPTSHNLWPFELVVWALLSLILFAAFLLARRFLVPERRPWHRDT
jgi:hypothetical protein